MPTITAQDYEISIRDGSWQLIPVGHDLSSRPAFRITRGGGVMEYTPTFGEAHKLPGTILSIEYIRAVVVGYDQKSKRWLLGFHLARSATEQPRWLELVQWPAGDNVIYGAAAQQAGRELAEHVGCPLKVFGAKKLARTDTTPEQSGVTGPLVPHKRENIGPQQVKLQAQSIKFPLEYPAMWLGQVRGNLTLRLDKEATANKRGDVAPAFNNCVFDPHQGSLRLLPPTGLLGAFFGGLQARELKFKEVRNVELRHSLIRRSSVKEDKQGLITDVTELSHRWDIYLTLPDESLLVAQTTHTSSSELARHRATSGDKFSVDSEAGIEYLRRHQIDQARHDRAQNWAQTAAIAIASTLGVHLVKTELEDS
jgi:hypothetical protein